MRGTGFIILQYRKRTIIRAFCSAINKFNIIIKMQTFLYISFQFLESTYRYSMEDFNHSYKKYIKVISLMILSHVMADQD